MFGFDFYKQKFYIEVVLQIIPPAKEETKDKLLCDFLPWKLHYMHVK